MGLKDTTTGDTLCDRDRPILLESISFMEPVISMAIEPKTVVDQERLIGFTGKTRPGRSYSFGLGQR